MRVRLVRHDLLRRLDHPLRPDRAYGDLVPRIGGTEQETAGAVGRDVGHAVSELAGGDVGELAARWVDGEPGDDLRLAARTSIEEAAIRTHCHRRRNARFGDA